MPLHVRVKRLLLCVAAVGSDHCHSTRRCCSSVPRSPLCAGTAGAYAGVLPGCVVDSRTVVHKWLANRCDRGHPAAGGPNNLCIGQHAGTVQGWLPSRKAVIIEVLSDPGIPLNCKRTVRKCGCVPAYPFRRGCSPAWTATRQPYHNRSHRKGLVSSTWVNTLRPSA